MIVNLIGTITDNTETHHLTQFNNVVTFFLHRALKSLGVDSNLVPYETIYNTSPPTCDHTIIIVGSAFVEFDTRQAKLRPHIFGTEERRKIAKKFCDRIYNSTRDKVTLYIDSNYPYWDSYFDKVFTVAPPKWPKDPTSDAFSKKWGESGSGQWIHPERYVYAGWGADPEYCYPDKGEQKTIFVDGYHKNIKYYNICKKWYVIIDRVLRSLDDAKTHRIHNYSGGERCKWPELQKRFRESHFYIDPQYGRTGLTRIESAMCGCSLVIAEPMFRPWAMNQGTTLTWNTEKELKKILNSETNPKQNHEKVKHITWDKVAKRMIVELEDD